MKPLKTVADIVRQLGSQYNNPKALNHLEDGQWVAFSSEDFLRAVKHLTLYLDSLHLKKGACIGIMAPGSVFWTITDFAIMLSGHVSVPLFANISNENFEYEIHHAQIEVLFTGGKEQWNMFNAHKADFKKVISFENHKTVFSLAQALKVGQEIYNQDPSRYEALLDAVDKDDLATIVYTSGSTGTPKGVELTHTSISSLLHVDPFQWNPITDRYLSILPLAHIFARALNFIMVSWGISTYYLHNIKQLSEAAMQVKPTICVLVPRVLEKIQANLLYHIQTSSGIKRWIGKWAWSLAKGTPDCFSNSVLSPIADSLVYSKFREAFGGKLRLIISGGAHLSPDLYRFYLEIGFPVYEGYGLTEASTVSCNRPGRIKVGTVGLPFETISAKISPEGELLVKGGLVMKGYHKDPAATAEAFTDDGWLRTGDRATIDSEGNITILGRLKELYKTTKGEFISPIPIEQLLTQDSFVDLAMVIANRRPFATCLLFPDPERIKKLQQKLKMERLSSEEFLKTPEVLNHIHKLLTSINKHLNHWEELHDFRLISTHPSVEGGELTPTMKLRREVIEKKYADLINSMYAEETV